MHKKFTTSNSCRHLLYGISFIFIINLAYIYRNIEYKKIASACSSIIPFTYSTVENLNTTENIINNKQTGSAHGILVGEYFLAYTAKLFDFTGSRTELQTFITSIFQFSAAITAGLLFIILISFGVSYSTSILSSSLYAVIPAAIHTTEGLHFCNGILALPLLATAILFLVLFYKKENIFLLPVFAFFLLLASIVSAITQIFIISSFIIVTPLYLYSIYKKINTKFISQIFTIIIVLAIFNLAYYLQSYKEFYIYGQLLWTKIQHLNCKPKSPSVLSFNMRLLWSGDLKSAGFAVYNQLFHYSFSFYIIILFIILLSNRIKNKLRESLQIYLLFNLITILFFALFCYFITLSAYAAFFLCISIGFSIHIIQTALKSRYIITVFLTTLLITEGYNSIISRPNEIYKTRSDSELVSYLFQNRFLSENVLCDYKIAPQIATYCSSKASIIINSLIPNSFFQLQNYYNILYNGSEKDLLNFCEKIHAEYLIFSRDTVSGGISPVHLTMYPMRYLAGCSKLKKKSIGYKLNFTPAKLSNFYLLDEQFPLSISDQYLIFKIISDNNMRHANILTVKAQKEFDSKRNQPAQNLIAQAIQLNPASPEARFLFFQIDKKWPYISVRGVEGQNITN